MCILLYNIFNINSIIGDDDVCRIDILTTRHDEILTTTNTKYIQYYYSKMQHFLDLFADNTTDYLLPHSTSSFIFVMDYYFKFKNDFDEMIIVDENYEKYGKNAIAYYYLNIFNRYTDIIKKRLANNILNLIILHRTETIIYIFNRNLTLYNINNTNIFLKTYINKFLEMAIRINSTLLFSFFLHSHSTILNSKKNIILSDLYIKIIKYNANINLMNILFNYGVPLDKYIFKYAVTQNLYDIVVWLDNHDCPFDINITIPKYFRESYNNIVALLFLKKCKIHFT